MTEGGSDFGVDAVEVSVVADGEFTVTLFQGKYKQVLEGDANFPVSREHFGKLYDIIFTPDLNGAQVVIATLLFRIAENKRKRPPAGAPEFLRYGSCFLGMLMGKYLLCDLGTQLDSLDHRRRGDLIEGLNTQPSLPLAQPAI